MIILIINIYLWHLIFNAVFKIFTSIFEDFYLKRSKLCYNLKFVCVFFPREIRFVTVTYNVLFMMYLWDDQYYKPLMLEESGFAVCLKSYFNQLLFRQLK